MSVSHPRRLRAAVLLAASTLSCAEPNPEPPAPPAAAPAGDLPRTTPAVASYTLRAELDAEQHAIVGEGEIDWVNSSSQPVDELYLHLYLNAFEGPRTLFYRNPSRRARGGREPERWGHIQIERLVARQLAGADLLPALEPNSPGDLEDRTDRRLALPQPIAPGEHLTLELRWTSVLPGLRVRTGFNGDFHFAGQWFPKLARLEPNGEWAHFAFDPLSEFYADFGVYDVSLNVPEEMVVGATGHLVSERRAGGRRTLRY
ncbi:MAG: M1 family peptidase, partial [Deltaproteobacteria bacterium]